jgi:hypothetical protein
MIGRSVDSDEGVQQGAVPGKAFQAWSHSLEEGD